MSNLVTVWEMEVAVKRTISDEEVEQLRGWLRIWEASQCEKGVASRWHISGATVAVSTEGEPQSLMAFASYALDNGTARPTEVRLRKMRTRPLDVSR